MIVWKLTLENALYMYGYVLEATGVYSQLTFWLLLLVYSLLSCWGGAC